MRRLSVHIYPDGAVGEMQAVRERAEIATSRLERARKLGGRLAGQQRQTERLLSGEHPNLRTAFEACERLVLGQARLLSLMSELLAEANAAVAGAIPHVDYAIQAARVDQFVADRARIAEAGLTVEALAS